MDPPGATASGTDSAARRLFFWDDDDGSDDFLSSAVSQVSSEMVDSVLAGVHSEVVSALGLDPLQVIPESVQDWFMDEVGLGGRRVLRRSRATFNARVQSRQAASVINGKDGSAAEKLGLSGKVGGMVNSRFSRRVL